MFRAIYNFLAAFFFDESEFVKMSSKLVAKVRGVLMIAGLSATALSGEIIESGGLDPKYAGKIKLAGIIVAGLSVMLRAGDKTPESVKALAAETPSAQ
jgi:hypothetical protein